MPCDQKSSKPLNAYTVPLKREHIALWSTDLPADTDQGIIKGAVPQCLATDEHPSNRKTQEMHVLSSFSTLRHSLKVFALGLCVCAVLPSISSAEATAESASDQHSKDASLLASSTQGEKAPDEFRIELETTKGSIIFEVNRAWAPLGVDRFYKLVQIGFYDDVAFYRVLPGTSAEFGIQGDPQLNMKWASLPIKDDPRLHPNSRGTLAFLQAGFNSRATRILLSLGKNPSFDRQGAAPFAKVVEGQEVLNMINATGESRPYGPGPKPQRIQNVGNSYLADQYPSIDYIRNIKILE